MTFTIERLWNGIACEYVFSLKNKLEIILHPVKTINFIL